MESSSAAFFEGRGRGDPDPGRAMGYESESKFADTAAANARTVDASLDDALGIDASHDGAPTERHQTRQLPPRQDASHGGATTATAGGARVSFHGDTRASILADSMRGASYAEHKGREVRGSDDHLHRSAVRGLAALKEAAKTTRRRVAESSRTSSGLRGAGSPGGAGSAAESILSPATQRAMRAIEEAKRLARSDPAMAGAMAPTVRRLFGAVGVAGRSGGAR